MSNGSTAPLSAPWPSSTIAGMSVGREDESQPSSLEHIIIVQALYQALNMFSKLFVVATSVIIILAAAMPNGTPPPPVTPPNSIQCCWNLVPASSANASAVAALVGLDLTGLDVDVGLGCNTWLIPNSCAGMNLACDAPEKEWGGLIAINCIPSTL